MSDAVEGWTIRPDHHSAFARTFVATPVEEVSTTYATGERRNGRFIEATYPARVSWLRFTFSWNEKDQYWWGQAMQYIELINALTGDGYRSGWRAGSVSQHFSLTDNEIPEYIRDIAKALKPRTTITVTETPA